MRSSVAAPTRSAASAGGIAFVPAQLAIQGGGVDPEHLGGARLVATFALEHPADIGALDYVERGIHVRTLGDERLGAPLRQLVGQRREIDRVPPREHDGPLERV